MDLSRDADEWFVLAHVSKSQKEFQKQKARGPCGAPGLGMDRSANSSLAGLLCIGGARALLAERDRLAQALCAWVHLSRVRKISVHIVSP
jgi:hypothetical protein